MKKKPAVDSLCEVPELTEKHFRRAIWSHDRRRIIHGDLRPGDTKTVRRFLGMTQREFARAMYISVATLRAWETGTKDPKGPAVTLLRIALRHPHILLALKRAA